MRWAVALLALSIFSQTAFAAQVVALGASNTFGRGMGRTADGVEQDQAWPAQLERLLKEQRCDVSVQNAGVPGDTTSGMLQRLPGLASADTKVLVFETPKSNDLRRNVTNTSENIDNIKAFARAHAIAAIPLGNWLSVAGIEHRQPDRQHFDAAAHLMMAKYLLPRVRAAACR